MIGNITGPRSLVEAIPGMMWSGHWLAGFDTRRIRSKFRAASEWSMPFTKAKPNWKGVVTIPLDFRHRDDNQNVQRAQTRLTEMLGQQGVNQVYVGLTLSGEAEMHGMPLPRIEQLARLIAGEVRERDVTLRYNDIYERSP